jgi:prepilin-type N-terminal cleavage/methylation domain-containing protein
MNKKGVTLIELIVVMVIIAIGAALSTPNIGGWMTSYRLRSATRDVVSTLRLAQIKAVSGNTTYQVVFDTANNSYIIQYLNTGGAYVTEGVTQVLPTGVTFNTDFGNVARFSPNSTVANTGAINFSNTKGTIKTIKLQSGRIKIE